MQGLLAGLLVLSVTYFGGKGLLQRFFFRTTEKLCMAAEKYQI